MAVVPVQQRSLVRRVEWVGVSTLLDEAPSTPEADQLVVTDFVQRKLLDPAPYLFGLVHETCETLLGRRE